MEENSCNITDLQLLNCSLFENNTWCENCSICATNCSSYGNRTLESPDSPPTFDLNVLIQVVLYSILFVIAASGNLTVFITLFRGRHRKSRINLMITHLTIADLLVTFFMIPMEIVWRITVAWKAGNAACKIFSMLRAFGLYLSSNVLVCVSMDRYFAILYPLKVNDARRRGKTMLLIAWIFSFLCASLQSIVFHVEQHPQHPNFFQCIAFEPLKSVSTIETLYNLFCVSAMYFIPLFIIIFAYSRILYEISIKSRENEEDVKSGRLQDPRGRIRLRKNDMSNIARAKARTLRMTITIVAAFIWCWTPYVVMTLWYMFDRESATKVDARIQDALFIMAVSNSCMNPMVYGSYAMNFRKDCYCLELKASSRNKLNRNSTSVVRLQMLNHLETDHTTAENMLQRVHRCLLSLVKARSVTTATKTTVFGGHENRRHYLGIQSHSECLPYQETIEEPRRPHSEVYIPPEMEDDAVKCRHRPFHSETAEETEMRMMRTVEWVYYSQKQKSNVISQ